MTRLGTLIIAIWATSATLGHTQARGDVTNLPIPRYVSMKASEGNIRRGPSLTHRIDWVFQHRNMPLQITAEYGNWRRVRDRDGVGGWIHYSLLSGVRTVIVETDMLPLYRNPSLDAQINANLELGVIAELEECTLNWCELEADGYSGWAPKSAFWGVNADEVFE
ncbi:SH3 domain-containing protein [Cochlodiniinecator piscidefendens]|uniref:SH3 domain-containing protein n=1 Tax=Cochlodiniinecator piscidefendens TaxID=2715756 RepID=UPI001409D91E|nr:SH3 domain-containing protein [Cochlodiniinecator piscidefendens]